MLTQELITYIIGVTTLITMGITLYNSLKKPQDASNIKEAVFDEKFKNLTETVENLRDNHLAHLDQKIDKHIEKQIENEQMVSNNFAKTFTLLDIIMKK